MADVRSMFDEKWVKAWDLNGKEITVTIKKVERGMVANKGGEKAVPVLWFDGAKKPLGLNKTNVKTIAGMYGYEASNWVGKSITLYPTVTTTKDGDAECIRVRPTAPKGKGEPMPERQPGEDDDK